MRRLLLHEVELALASRQPPQPEFLQEEVEELSQEALYVDIGGEGG